MTGDISLPVPIYSAIKRNGKPLHEYARKGKVDKVEIPVKTMHVIASDLKEIDKEHGVLKIYFNVKSGTYIRSLAEELGRRLGTVATLQNLRRISIGPYKIEDAIII